MRILRNLVGAAGIALSVLAVASPSFAQVLISGTTPPQQPHPRQYASQQVHYIRTTLAYTMCTQSSNACTVKVANAALPYNSIVLRVGLFVYTAFNSSTSDALSVGTTSANANEIVSSTMSLHSQATVSGSVVSTAFNNTGNTVTQSGANGGLDIWVKWTAGTGNTATAGLASLVIEYVPPNDGLCTSGIALGAAPAGC